MDPSTTPMSPGTGTDIKHVKVQDQLLIQKSGGPSVGGAYRHYFITRISKFPQLGDMGHLAFQDGGVQDVGTNGISNEALLGIVIDRLEDFQRGPFPCPENVTALAHAKAALKTLEERTRARVVRGVEGKSVA